LKLDGQDIWPDITGQRIHPEERVFYWRTPGQMAIRKGDWKLIRGLGPDMKTELFNIKKDPLEKEDLSAKYPEKVDQLLAILGEEQKCDKNI
jgi:arylsulfatase A-like enzyme